MEIEYTYAEFRDAHPELFRNPPEGIEILDGPDSGRIAHRDRFITLIKDNVRFPDGSEGTYNRLYSTDLTQGAAVLPILPDGRIVLIEHFRHATRDWHWEIPRGCGTPGLSGKQTAETELGEEIGARVLHLHYLGEVHTDSGLMAQPVLLYAARIDSIGQLDDHECIRKALPCTVADIENQIRAGVLRDGFTLAAMYRARLAGIV